jgi:hypothetical protein
MNFFTPKNVLRKVQVSLIGIWSLYIVYEVFILRFNNAYNSENPQVLIYLIYVVNIFNILYTMVFYLKKVLDNKRDLII